MTRILPENSVGANSTSGQIVVYRRQFFGVRAEQSTSFLGNLPVAQDSRVDRSSKGFMVWVKKSPTEYKADNKRWLRKRFNPLPPLFATLFFGGVSTILNMAGFHGRFSLRPYDPLPLERWPKTLIEGFPEFLLVLMVGFLVIYLFQLVFGPLNFENRGGTLICTRCFAAKNKNDGDQCKSCGGFCEPLEQWKWIDKERA